MSITENIIEDKVVTKAENDVALIKHNSGDEFRNYFETTEDDQLDPARIDKFFAEADQPFIEQFVYDVNTGVKEHFAKGDDDLQNRGYYQRALPLLERFQEHQAKAGRKDFAVLEAKKNAEINAAWASRKKDYFLPIFKGDKQLEEVPEKHRERAMNVQFIAEANELDPNHVNKNYELFRAQLWNGYEMEGKPTDKGLRERIKQDLVKADDRQTFFGEIAQHAQRSATKGLPMEWTKNQDLFFDEYELGKHGVSKANAQKFYRESHRAFSKTFKDVAPIAQSFINDIVEGENDDTFLIDAKDKSRKTRIRETMQKVSKLPKEEREKFLYLVYQMGENQQTSSDSMSENFSKSISRANDAMLVSGGKFLTDLFGGLEGDLLAYQELRNDLLNIKSIVRKLDPIKNNWVPDKFEQGLYDTTSSLPRMLLAGSSGLGMVAGMGIFGAENDTKLRNDFPEMEANTRKTVAYTAGIAQGAIERLQFRTAFKGAPKTTAFIKGLGANGAVASFLGRAIMATGKEYVQERVQDAMLPLVQEIGSKLNEDIPEVKAEVWEETLKLYDERTFFAVLPLAILGAGGSTAMDKMGAERFRKYLANEDQLMLSGLTKEEAGIIQGMNENGSINSHKEYQKIIQGKDADEIKANSEAAIEDGAIERTIEAEVMENGTDAQKKAFTETNQALDELKEANKRVNGDIRKTEDGRLEVVFPESHKKVNEYFETEQEAYDAHRSAIEDFDMQQSAEIEAKQAQIEELQSKGIKNADDARRAVGEFVDDAVEGAETQFIDKDHGLKQMLQKGEISTAEALDALRVANLHYKGKGEITLETARVEGENRLRRNAKGFINKIFRGGNVATVFHEASEGYVKNLIKNEGYTYDYFAKHLGDFQRATGQILAKDVNNFTKREVIEGWSELAQAHVYNERESSSFPPAIRAILGAFKHFFNSVLDTASNLLQLKQDGKLDGDFEMHLNKAVGLDEDTIKNNQQKRYEREIMEEMLDPETELSYIMKGKIPRPSDLAENETLKGEVQRIWDELNNFDRKGRRYAGKANAWFADKGSNRTLHRAREHANEEGFAFETEAEMLEALEASITGDSQYPSGQASFSISPAQDAEIHLNKLYEKLDSLDIEVNSKDVEFNSSKLKKIYTPESVSDLDKYDKESLAEYGEVEDVYAQIEYDGAKIEIPVLVREEGEKVVFSYLGETANDTYGENATWYDKIDNAIKHTIESKIEDELETSDIESTRLAEHSYKFESIKWLKENGIIVKGEIIYPNKTSFDEVGVPSDEVFTIASTGSIYLMVEGKRISMRNHQVSRSRELQFGNVDKSIFIDWSNLSDIKNSFTQLNNEVNAENRASFSITPAQDASYLSEEGTTATDETLRKEAQLKIILDNNPALDDYHTWIRQISDIKNFEESLNDSDYKEYYEAGEDFDDSYSAEMAEEALRSGVITVYSSYPINQGIFVSPSTMEAEQYAGDGELYSKEVNISDVAWIDPTQGQYAKVNQPGFSISPAQDASYLSAVDSDGNVIPLSERFNDKDDRISYSIAPAQDPLIAKIQKLIRDPETKATVFKVMAMRLDKLKAQQNAKLTKRLFDGEGELSSHEELLDSIAQLDAIIAVLPREVRGQIRGYKKLAELKTVKGRTNYLIKRMERVDDVLEKFMVKSYKEAIKKMFDKSKPKSKNKASDAGQSKIGAIGHLIAEAAQAASVMNAEQAELRAAEIRREVEDPQPEEQQELEDRAYVTEMFADMESADSNRLDQLLDILQSNWDEGRKEWVKVLAERKEWKDSTIEKARQAFGVSVRNDGDTTSKTGREDGLIKKMAKDALNIFHVGDLLREGDKNESDSVWKEFNDDLRRAKNKNENLDLKHREEMKSVIVRIFGFKRNKQAQVQDRLRVLSKQVKQTGVTKTQEYELEIATNQKDLDKAEKAFQAGEDIVIRGNTLTKSEYQELSIGWQDAVANGYEPAGRKLFRYSLMRNEGERSSIGEMSQLDMLKDWLSIQQKDLKEKYEKNGYDEQYRDELDSALEEDVKELGLWMQNKLKDDQEIQQALHREEYGLALRLIDNYFPAVFEHGGKQSTTLTMDGVEIGQSTNRPSAHKLRVNHNSRPKKQNAFAVFNGHIMQRNFWESHAEVLRKWASVIRDKNMQDYILRAKGQTTLNLLNRWLSETENQGADVAKVHIETDHLWRSIGKGMALGILGGRISTIFKNLIASTNVVLSTNFTDLLRGFSPELMNDVRDLYESDTFQRRLKMGATVATRHAFEARASGRLELATAVRAAEYPVQAINLADTLSNMTFALAYRAKIKELELGGMNEAEAKEKALDHVDDLVDRFAQPTSRLSKSLWENTRTPESVFLVQFMSDARKVVTINMLALRKIFTGKGVGNRSDASRQLMTSIIVNSLLVHAVNSLMSAFVKGEGDDPEEEFINQLTDGKRIASAMMTESFAGIPLLGDGWKMIVNESLGQKTYDSSSNPATKLAKSASSAYSLLTDDKDRTASEMTDSILRVVQGFGSISPYTSIFSQGANVARDGLGFYNNTLDKGLSEEDSKQLSVDRITKKYSAIKKVDADTYKDADKLEKKQISSSRHEAIEQYLLDYLMELPEKRRKMVIDELKEKKSVPKDVMKRVEREVIQ